MDRYSIKYTFDAGRALEAPRDNVEIDYSFDTTDFSQVEILIVPVLGWASSLYQVLAKRCPPARFIHGKSEIAVCTCDQRREIWCHPVEQPNNAHKLQLESEFSRFSNSVATKTPSSNSLELDSSMLRGSNEPPQELVCKTNGSAWIQNKIEFNSMTVFCIFSYRLQWLFATLVCWDGAQRASKN
jgi:hypothetical protein